MYGLPKQSIKQWEETLDEVIKISPPHISLYGLKIEEGTKFYKLYKDMSDKEKDIQADMFQLAHDKLKKYNHYEFSNFAKNKKYFSKHNSAYWLRKNYYGFGLSASGFIGNKRYTNTFNIKEYIKNPLKRSYTSLQKRKKSKKKYFSG